ncbi:DUF916 and DUF3324 domain-containing protein [Lactiplantibacillus plantarum]|uniref:DUF916 and DUF3324 domain-containing protein n=1 Tax=Lactiplantibacillus plantarum TaxID=1590 RepID=UPI001C1F6A61|nr:DUF916 and DUF3324 domain-containing protein [Lactiplantibacillus plantarum]MBU7470382.1 DUF916 and DUF3324 domain-containing protein [Lactiplantibacillus plantarum]
MKKWQWILGLLISFSGCWNLTTVQAEQNHYNVQAILPKNQVNQESNFFDILVHPGQTQILTIKINNQDQQSHQYNITTNLAITGPSGNIIYNQNVKKNDSSLIFNVSTATSPINTVTVPAKKAWLIHLKTKIPKKQFPGIALGGINVVQHAAETNGKNVQIRNQFAYTIGVQLRETKKLTVIPYMNLKTVTPVQINYKNYIAANLQNPRAVIMHHLFVSSYITKKAQHKKLWQTTGKDMTMAPNSNFNFLIGDGSKPLTAGNYTLHLKASAENGKYNWKTAKHFTISKQQAATIQTTNTSQIKPTTNWSLIGILIGIIVILLGLIIWMLFKKKHNKY